MLEEHELREKKMFNLFPFLLQGIPRFSLTCFDSALYEYENDWTLDEKCFLTTCKSHFQNSKRLSDHETIRKKHYARNKHNCLPFGNSSKLIHLNNLIQIFLDIYILTITLGSSSWFIDARLQLSIVLANS
jgi:hypothetical protein